MDGLNKQARKLLKAWQNDEIINITLNRGKEFKMNIDNSFCTT